jgi:hypothetical protein
MALLFPEINHFRKVGLHAGITDPVTEVESGVLREILIKMQPVPLFILGLAAIGTG